MAIGLTNKQRNQLSAMLPSVQDSIVGLKRLIADAKDRTRALQRLADAAEAQKRHAREVGIPFNANAFAQRKKELDALPASLTFEAGQLSSFVALQKAISAVVDGPHVRDSVGSRASAKKTAGRRQKAQRVTKAKKGVVKTASSRGKAAGKSARPQKPLPLSLGS